MARRGGKASTQRAIKGEAKRSAGEGQRSGLGQVLRVVRVPLVPSVLFLGSGVRSRVPKVIQCIVFWGEFCELASYGGGGGSVRSHPDR